MDKIHTSFYTDVFLYQGRLDALGCSIIWMCLLGSQSIRQETTEGRCPGRMC